MVNFLKKILLNNVQLKIFSLIFGYLLWSVIGQSHTDDVWMDVPVCFYQTEKNIQIEAPETTKVHLSGKRSDLKNIHTDKTAVHINSCRLKEGDNKVIFNDNDIMVPENVQITGWAPKDIKVRITKNP